MAKVRKGYDLSVMMDAGITYPEQQSSRFFVDAVAPPSDNQIIEVSLDDLVPYHRKELSIAGEKRIIFQDYSLDKLSRLADDIEEHDVLEPIIIFPSQIYPEKYEILAGEHRSKAQKLVRDRNHGEDRWKTIRAVYRSYEVVSANNFAIGDLIYTGTNLHCRDQLKRSELALVFRVRSEALNHQGKRDSAQRTTREEIAAQAKIPPRHVDQIKNITVEKIIPELIPLIDDDIISLGAAGQQLHRISRENQQVIYNWAKLHCSTTQDGLAKYLGKMLTIGRIKQIIDIIEQSENHVITDDDLYRLYIDADTSRTFHAPSSAALRAILPQQYHTKPASEIVDFLQRVIEEYEKNHPEQ